MDPHVLSSGPRPKHGDFGKILDIRYSDFNKIQNNTLFISLCLINQCP